MSISVLQCGFDFLLTARENASSIHIKFQEDDDKQEVILDSAAYDIEVPSDTIAIITSSKPVLVAQLCKSHGADGNRDSDPFISLVSPVSLYTSSFSFATPVDYAGDDYYQSYLNIISRTASVGNILYDGKVLDTTIFQRSWTEIDDTGFSAAVIHVTPGRHTVIERTASGLCLTLYGLAYQESYGMALGQIYPVLGCLSDSLECNQKFSMATLTATPTDIMSEKVTSIKNTQGNTVIASTETTMYTERMTEGSKELTTEIRVTTELTTDVTLVTTEITTDMTEANTEHTTEMLVTTQVSTEGTTGSTLHLVESTVESAASTETGPSDGTSLSTMKSTSIWFILTTVAQVFDTSSIEHTTETKITTDISTQNGVMQGEEFSRTFLPSTEEVTRKLSQTTEDVITKTETSTAKISSPDTTYLSTVKIVPTEQSTMAHATQVSLTQSMTPSGSTDTGQAATSQPPTTEANLTNLYTTNSTDNYTDYNVTDSDVLNLTVTESNQIEVTAVVQESSTAYNLIKDKPMIVIVPAGIVIGAPGVYVLYHASKAFYYSFINKKQEEPKKKQATPVHTPIAKRKRRVVPHVTFDATADASKG